MSRQHTTLAARLDYMQRMRFGFEFETIVEVTPIPANYMFTKLLMNNHDGDSLQQLREYATQVIETEVPGFTLDDPSRDEYALLDPDKMIRMFLASMLNTTPENKGAMRVWFRQMFSSKKLTIPMIPKFKEAAHGRVKSAPLPRKGPLVSRDSVMGHKSDPAGNLPMGKADKRPFAYKSDTAFGDAWTITVDASVTCKRPYYEFYYQQADGVEDEKRLLDRIEIVSGILSLRDEAKIRHVVANVFPCRVRDAPRLRFWHNTNTSMHVHVSCDDLFREPERLLGVCMAWWQMEPLLCLFVAKWRKKNSYCMLMRDIVPRLDTAVNVLTKHELTVANIFRMFQNPARMDGKPRYAAFNMVQLGDHGYGTIEVRLRHGSSDAEEVVQWTKLLTRFFAAALAQGRPQGRLDPHLVDAMRILRPNVTMTKERVKTIRAALDYLFDTYVVLGAKDQDKEGHAMKKYWMQRLPPPLTGTSSASRRPSGPRAPLGA